MAAFLNNQAKVATTSFLLFCLSLFITAYSDRHPEVSQIGFSVISEIQRPFQIAVDRASNSVSAVWEGYINLINVKAENTLMRSRLAVLESMNSQLLEYRSENERLKQMLDIIEEKKFKAIASSVIGYDSTSLAGSIVLDRGRNHGVKTEMPVLLADHVVGQIIAVSPNSSKALLITDTSSAVDAIVQDSRVRGVVRGLRRYNICDLQYVLPEDEVKVGDRIITSGMDGVFPKGLLIGIVREVNKNVASIFQKVTIRPSVDFSKLENVLILVEDSSQEYE